LRRGRRPKERTVVSIFEDSSLMRTPGRATAMAAARAAMAASTKGRFSGASSTFTVTAVSTTQPSMCTPMSSLAKSPEAS
jgi:hypothetical protein